MEKHLSPGTFAELAKYDTCVVANAVDSLKIRLLNEGFSASGIARRVDLPSPMVGLAVTLKVRSTNPPMKSAYYLEQPDWWERLEESVWPRVLVIQDEDARPGRGSLVGPVHACIIKALGFVGVVTTGAIRGTRSFSDIGLHAFSGNLSPAHAYCHVVEMGGIVEIAGMEIRPGEVIHGDKDGIVVVPPDLAPEIPEIAKRFLAREEAICRYCNSRSFSRQELKGVISADESRW
jgi:4-hydroxy-4-methyl-2-oxoglutarate aldolase